MRTKRRRLTTSTVPPPATPTTTIASLPDDVVADILLRLPSPTSIFRAALSSKHWCRVAVSPSFVRRIRELYHFPALLGHFLCCIKSSTFPLFQPVDLHADHALAAVVRRGDFFLTRLQDSGQCALEDCHDGYLLFSNRTKLTIFDPTTHHAVYLPRPPRRPAPENDYVAHTFCLLRDSGGANDQRFFRVISLQHRNRSARVEDYDSRAGEWRAHPYTAATPARSHDNRYFPAMHAAGRIYWKYSSTPLLLCLDTKTMRFSYVGIPAGVSPRSAYAVGETEDGSCCLVHVWNGSEGGCLQLQVWLRGAEAEPWVLEREEPLLLRSRAPVRGRARQVRAVVAGLVLVCFNGSSAHLPHVAFRLKNLKVEAEFTCRGPARPYLFE
uniref:Uncharacterized protein n=1 Tax=Avena sativa TaxID=4498 RepID=A0ACD5V4C2_AVESA